MNYLYKTRERCQEVLQIVTMKINIRESRENISHPDTQNGFEAGPSTIDNILCFIQVTENALQYGIDL